MRARLAAVTPVRVIEWFVLANLAFLGLDILVAHQENAFRDPAEWAPVVFSAIAPLVLLPGALHAGPPRLARTLDLGVASTAILVGVVGMAFHLSSAFFADRTLASLVYSAPFIAPLSYVGVGLLLLLVRLEGPGSRQIGPWTLFLALGGFVGNLALSLLDHAQNGFFDALEWVPVGAAAFACSFFAVALVTAERALLRVCLGVCALEGAVGVAGFALHVRQDLRGSAASLADRFVHGAPAFAPLLFTDLAALAAVGIWAMMRQERVRPAT
jgi:hypothetical protein